MVKDVRAGLGGNDTILNFGDKLGNVAERRALQEAEDGEIMVARKVLAALRSTLSGGKRRDRTIGVDWAALRVEGTFRQRKKPLPDDVGNKRTSFPCPKGRAAPRHAAWQLAANENTPLMRGIGCSKRSV